MRIIRYNNKDSKHNCIFIFQYNVETVDKCRALKEKVGWQKFCYNQELKGWTFLFEVWDKVMDVFENSELEIDENLFSEYRKWNEEQLRRKNAIEKAKTFELEVDLPLFPYQKIGANFIVNGYKVMVNDSAGSGKSLESIAAFHYLNLKNILIICLNSLKVNWQAEIYKWLKAPSHIVNGEFQQGINILNYDKLLKFSEEVKLKNGKMKLVANDYIKNFGWDMIIVDESQGYRNPKAKKTKIGVDLCKSCERVALLTGTPIMNRPAELIPQLDAIGRLDEFGGAWKFLLKYCFNGESKFGKDFSGAKNLSDLKEKLKPFTIRRTKAEILPDLPPRMVYATYLEMPEPKEYKEVKKKVAMKVAEYKSWVQDVYHSLKDKTKTEEARILVEMRSDPRFGKLTSVGLNEMETLKQEATRQKLIACKELFETYIENGNKIVVFTTHKKTTYDLATTYNGLWITGDIAKVEERMKVLEQFKAGKEQFLFGTIQTIGTGLNITEATECVFIEMGWTPAEHDQAIDRLHRIGQKNSVNANFLILKDSIDEYIWELLQEKDEIIKEGIGNSVFSSTVVKVFNNLFEDIF